MDCPKGCADAVKIEAGPPGATYSSVDYRPVRLRERGSHFICPGCDAIFDLCEATTSDDPMNQRRLPKGHRPTA